MVAVAPVTLLFGATLAVSPAGAPRMAKIQCPARRERSRAVAIVTVDVLLAPPAVSGSGFGLNVNEAPAEAPPLTVAFTVTVASAMPRARNHGPRADRCRYTALAVADTLRVEVGPGALTGFMLAVTPAGAPVTVKPTAPANGAVRVMVIVDVTAAAPAATLSALGLATSEIAPASRRPRRLPSASWWRWWTLEPSALIVMAWVPGTTAAPTADVDGARVRAARYFGRGKADRNTGRRTGCAQGHGAGEGAAARDTRGGVTLSLQAPIIDTGRSHRDREGPRGRVVLELQALMERPPQRQRGRTRGGCGGGSGLINGISTVPRCGMYASGVPVVRDRLIGSPDFYGTPCRRTAQGWRPRRTLNQCGPKTD
jgi:hypothetical protein